MPGLLSLWGNFGRINQLVSRRVTCMRNWPCNDPVTAGLSPRKPKILPHLPQTKVIANQLVSYVSNLTLILTASRTEGLSTAIVIMLHVIS